MENDMDIVTDKITHKQIKMIEWQLSGNGGRTLRTHEWAPDEWKDLPGRPIGEWDWRDHNSKEWIGSNLSSKAASALITALSEKNVRGAQEILFASGIPRKNV